MNAPAKKNFLKRLLNIGVVFRYMSESAAIVRQGFQRRDKLILFSYFVKTPFIVLKSLVTGKTFRELEEKNKFLRGDVRIGNKYGLFNCGNNILTVHMVNENNEKWLYQYLSPIGGVFIDVGAHIGKYSIRAARNPTATIIAIEPDPYNFALLQKNAEANFVSHKIKFVNKGAFSSPGKMPFYTTEQGEGMHSIYKQPESRHETTIEVDTLDNIIGELKIDDYINLVKIDVEGAELEVLKGAENILQKEKPDLIIEVWQDDPSRLEQINAYLQRFGYEKAQQLDKENMFFTCNTKNSLRRSS